MGEAENATTTLRAMLMQTIADMKTSHAASLDKVVSKDEYSTGIADLKAAHGKEVATLTSQMTKLKAAHDGLKAAHDGLKATHTKDAAALNATCTKDITALKARGAAVNTAHTAEFSEIKRRLAAVEERRAARAKYV